MFFGIMKEKKKEKNPEEVREARSEQVAAQGDGGTRPRPSAKGDGSSRSPRQSWEIGKAR